MEIIDILTPDYDDCPNFTVNNAVDFVQVVNIIEFEFKACNLAASKFLRGDNFTVLSSGYFIPERFVLYSTQEVGGTNFSAPILQLYGTVGGGSIPLLPFGNNGQLKLPLPNYEISLGCTIDAEANGLIDPLGFILRGYFPTIIDSLQVSMIDVPLALNGKKFNIVPFIKILHNFQLV